MNPLNLDIFPRISSEEWAAAATLPTSGQNPFDALQWGTKGMEGLLPYYDQETAIPEGQTHYFASIESHRWKLYETIHIENEVEANYKALEALAGGCDGIIFKLSTSLNETILLKNIDTSICDILFFKPKNITLKSETVLSEKNCFICTLNESPINQIKECLLNVGSQQWIFRSTFSDFFLEISTIRALRFLLDEFSCIKPNIHSSVSAHEKADHQWFLNTTASLAAILGGSHSVDMPAGMSNARIARNVGNIIREESKIKHYEDQCGGSYFVEALTAKIIEEVTKELNEE